MTAIISPYNGLVKCPWDVIGLTGYEVTLKELALLSHPLDTQIPLLYFELEINPIFIHNILVVYK